MLERQRIVLYRELLDQFFQSIKVDRLDHALVATGSESFHTVLSPRMSGNGDDWHSGERWPFANSPGGRQTVDYQEGHIHQNQIRPLRQLSLDCRFAIIGF